jgi:hypothetical protein
MTPGLLVLMTVDTPVIVVMASLAVFLVVIKFISMFYYPTRIVVFNPPVFMIEGHAILFNVFMTNIACNLLFTPFFMAWDACTKHIRDKVWRNCLTLLNALMALITLYLIFKMRLMGKF